MSKDIVIIGAGPAGEAAAKSAWRILSSKGSEAVPSIILLEKEEAGGLCLNKGCIPSKTLLEHVHKKMALKQPIEWGELQDVKNEVVRGIREQLQSTLKRQKINLIHGLARFKDKSSIDLMKTEGGEVLPFEKAVITTGTEIFFPPPLDQHREELLDSDRVLEMTETPHTILIVGGGAIGCEFACLLNAAGSEVTLVELTSGLLPGEDANVVAALQRSFEQRGMNIKTSTKVSSLSKLKNGWDVSLSNGDHMDVEKVLVCVGRTPKPELLDLDKAGIKVDKKFLVINKHLQTTNPNVYAAGDITGETRLAHAASLQGEIAAANALGEAKTYDGSLIPRCLYSWPEVASVGKWKHQIEEENKAVKVSRAFFKGSAKALASGETEGFVQIVSDGHTGQILGAQIIGARATELIHIFSLAISQKMTTKWLGDIVFAHPTLSELVRDAARK